MPKGDADRLRADTADGFERLANLLGEALAFSPLTGTQLKIMHFVTRLTYGWANDRDRDSGKMAMMTADKISRGTRLSKRTVEKAVPVLVRANVLLRDDIPSANCCAYGPNPDIAQWGDGDARWEGWHAEFLDARKSGVYTPDSVPPYAAQGTPLRQDGYPPTPDSVDPPTPDSVPPYAAQGTPLRQDGYPPTPDSVDPPTPDSVPPYAAQGTPLRQDGYGVYAIQRRGSTLDSVPLPPTNPRGTGVSCPLTDSYRQLQTEGGVSTCTRGDKQEPQDGQTAPPVLLDSDGETATADDNGPPGPDWEPTEEWTEWKVERMRYEAKAADYPKLAEFMRSKGKDVPLEPKLPPPPPPERRYKRKPVIIPGEKCFPLIAELLTGTSREGKIKLWQQVIAEFQRDFPRICPDDRMAAAITRSPPTVADAWPEAYIKRLFPAVDPKHNEDF